MRPATALAGPVSLGLCCIVTALLIAPRVHGGAPASATRLETLPHVCRGGPLHGRPCTSPDECGPGRCVIELTAGPGSHFSGTVTFIVDDDVSRFDGSEEIGGVVAVTVLLEIDQSPDTRGNRLFAQTYQNLGGATLEELVENLRAGPFIADTALSGGGGGTGEGGGGGGGGGGGTGGVARGNRVTEDLLNFTVARGRIFDNFLFQEADDELADALRKLFRTTGRPVIVRTQPEQVPLAHADHAADGLASIVRLRVWGRFVAQ